MFVTKRCAIAIAVLSCFLLYGCGGTESTDNPSEDGESSTVTSGQASVTEGSDADVSDASIAIGQVRTVEIGGVAFTSLPETGVESTQASTDLGHLLFWDPILSGDMDTACATCHLPDLAYSDGLARSSGTGSVGTGAERVPGQLGLARRNAQSLVNIVWNGINEFGVFDQDTAAMFWDNRTVSLQRQAIEPIRALEEMRGTNFSEDEIEAEVISRLAGNADYQQLFAAAFGEGTITMAHVSQALADYQSTLIANNAPFDRWVRGEDNAMSAQQINGMQVFAETGCAECHSGPMFSDFDTHVLGVREADGLEIADVGDGSFGFRTPTLRQLAFTAPYFHGGQESTLDDVLDFYDNPRNSENPNVGNNELDADFLALPNLNNNEANAIEAFLGALNDGGFDRTRPASVPSGLPVGGAL